MESTWFILVLLSCVFGTAAAALQRLTLKDSRINDIAFIIYYHFLVILVTLPAAVLNPGTMPGDIKVWGLVLAAGLVYAVRNVLFYRALKSVEVSQASIIGSTKSLWVLFGGAVFLGETITFNKILGILMITFGVIMVYWYRDGLKGFGIWQWFIGASALLQGAGSIFDKYLVSYFTLPVYQVIMFFLPAFLAALFVPRAVGEVGSLLKSRKFNLLMLISAICYGLTAFMFYWAYKAGGEVSRVTSIGQLTTILTVLIGIVFLKERENALRKIIGAVVVVAGVVIIKSM